MDFEVVFSLRSDRKLVARRQRKLSSVRAEARRKSHSFCKARIRLSKTESEAHGPRCRDLMLPCPPCSYFSRIFDIVECINQMDNAE